MDPRVSRWGLSLVLVATLAWATDSHAQASITLDMPAQSLSVTLNRVARAGSVELAFDRAVTDHLRAPQLKGRFTVDRALAAALASTGLGVQRTRDGAYVVKAVSMPPAVQPRDDGDGAVSEILVLGRRNLNTGIRRTRDDIQPYDVALDETIRTAGAGDAEAFLRQAMPADAQSASLVQAPVANAASARSRIDLLGLGSGQTLVLVDGRRLPSIPEGVGNGAGFVQADVNGIPTAAIERIEVLTAAAGALYGPGATGGVVNIILKRDYQGAEVNAAQGFTEHGGGLTSRVDASVGRSSRDGRSGLSVRVALARDHGLDVGERIFGERALMANGLDFTDGRILKPYVPVGAGVNVTSIDGPLTLKAAYGGAALGSVYTNFSTTGFTATDAIANAGKLNLELAPDAFGVKQSLTTETRRRSVIVSGRHEAGIFEGFFDYLLLDNRGSAVVPAGKGVLGLVSKDSVYNPFEQAVYVSRSVPWDGDVGNRSFTQRANLGLIARLPRGWMAEADISHSRSLVRMTSNARELLNRAGLATDSDRYGPGISPFASQEVFLAGYSAYQVADGSFMKLSDRLSDVNLRASGPLWRLPGGPMTMTFTAEASRERAPGGESFGFDLLSQASTIVQGNQLRLSTRSAYAEWRAPLGDPNGAYPLRGLELQVALRGDAYRMTVPQSYMVIGPTSSLVMRDGVAKHDVMAKTLGLKTFAADGVMLRASYSEGHLPPRADQAQPLIISTSSWPAADPKRGGDPVGWGGGGLTLVQNGSLQLDPELARTYGVGVVVAPRGLTGARLSIDYQRTEKRHEITAFAAGNAAYFLAREARYPTRVVRGPLTDADRAKGYTAGPVTFLDTSAMNSGRSIAETVDVSAEYRHGLWGGHASANLRGVWQPSYRRIADPDKSWIETTGYSDGPLRIRVFAGAQWSGDALVVGVNAQYYESYRAAASGFLITATDQAIANQADVRIPSQVYLSAFGRWTFGEKTQVQLNVRNLLDARPPLALAAPTGYSTYGEAQGRSFELSLTRRF